MNVCPEWLCGVVMRAQSVHEMTHGGGKRREEEWGGCGGARWKDMGEGQKGEDKEGRKER